MSGTETNDADQKTIGDADKEQIWIDNGKLHRVNEEEEPFPEQPKDGASSPVLPDAAAPPSLSESSDAPKPNAQDATTTIDKDEPESRWARMRLPAWTPWVLGGALIGLAVGTVLVFCLPKTPSKPVHK